MNNLTDEQIKATLSGMSMQIHANLDGAYALHCALIAYRMYDWKDRVIGFISKDCPHFFAFPATDSHAMPIQIIKRFYPSLWLEIEHWPVGKIIEAANEALYPLDMNA